MSGETTAGPSRRRLFATAGGNLAAAGSGFGARSAEAVGRLNADIEGFWGPHQGGIVTPAQSHTYFAAFDLTTTKRDDVASLLRRWTNAAARLTQGRPIEPIKLDQAYDQDPGTLTPDTGDTLELAPARLTVTFGFGAGLFVKDNQDRYGLASRRPEAFVDLPKFNGDQLIAALTSGDLSVQACANDPQVAFHAVRQLAQIAFGVAEIRWAQTGFLSRPANGTTPRNLMGFKDGTQVPKSVDKAVWVGNEGPKWMQGGSYLIVRRIRIALEHWDRTKIDFQEQTVGRHKLSGAPLGLKDEFAPLGLDRTDGDEIRSFRNTHMCGWPTLPTWVRRKYFGEVTPTMTASTSSPNAGHRGTKPWSTTLDYCSYVIRVTLARGSSKSLTIWPNSTC